MVGKYRPVKVIIKKHLLIDQNREISSTISSTKQTSLTNLFMAIIPTENRSTDNTVPSNPKVIKFEQESTPRKRNKNSDSDKGSSHFNNKTRNESAKLDGHSLLVWHQSKRIWENL